MPPGFESKVLDASTNTGGKDNRREILAIRIRHSWGGFEDGPASMPNGVPTIPIPSTETKLEK